VRFATGRFAMGSNEALGEPQDQETIDVDVEAPKTPMGTQNVPAADGKGKGEASSSGLERKRGLSEGKGQMYGGLIKSVDGLSSAIRAGTPGIYRAVMDVPDFYKEAQMFCLNYLMLNKGIVEIFLEMDERDKGF
jgi:hypothetical protein